MVCILYLLILFSNCLETHVPFINYFDEILVIGLLFLALFKIAVLGTGVGALWNRYDNMLAVLMAGFLFIGILSSFFGEGMLSGIGMVKDLMLVSKFFLCYLCGKLLFVTMDRDHLIDRMRAITKFSIVVIFVCGVISLFFRTGMGDQIRFGIRSYQFLYTHYTFLVYAEVIMIGVICSKNENGDGKYLVMALCTLLMTLRTKAVVFGCVCIVFFLFKKNGREVKLYHYAAAGGIGLVIAWGKIQEYLSYGFTYNMRNGLYAAGVKLAVKYFPLGSGFCTFGSNLSYAYNRQMYDNIHLTSYQGFDTGTPVLSDVFWPYIYGQFGIAGMIIYILMLVMVFYSMKEELREENSDRFQGVNMIFIYLILASMAEAMFTNNSGVFSAFLLSVCLGRKEMDKEVSRKPYVMRL